MVASSDFFLARCCKRTELTEVLLFSTSNVYFLFAKDTVQKGTFRKGSNLYSTKLFVKIENLKRFLIQNIRCSSGNDLANMNMIIEVGWKQTTLGKGVVKNSVKINTPHICHNHHNCKSVKGYTQFCCETTFVAN